MPPQFSATVFTRQPQDVAAFYVEVFDLAVATDIGWFVSLHRPDGTWEVCLWDPDHESVPTMARAAADSGIGPVLAFVVEDVDTIAARARDRGAETSEQIDEPWGQRHVFVRDPAGTTVDVVQITTPDPAWMEANGLA